MTYSILHSSKALELFLGCFALLAVIAGWLCPRIGSRAFSRLEVRLTCLARRPLLAAVLVSLFPMLWRLAIAGVYPAPVPYVHDEFSYLLLGDTIAHGRIANPTPPEWQHFETEYELMTPTYSSQYQPAQGLVLAAGELATGEPWWGVWLSCGLMCGAVFWSLSGVLPPGWALLGSALVALQFGIFGFWMNSYFGGAVPAIGGCLVFGVIVRLQKPRSNTGIVSLAGGTGLAILLASRPAEALIWIAAMSIALLRGGRRLVAAGSVVGLTVSAGIGVLALYNTRITGHAWKIPYMTYRQQYGTPQSYWWQPAIVAKPSTHPELQANYTDQLNFWKRRYSATALWDAEWRRLRDFWRFFIGPFSTPAVLFLPWVFNRRRIWPWLGLSAVFVLDHSTFHAWYPQHSATETILIAWLLVECWRRLRVWRRHIGTGRAMTRQLALAFAVALLLISAGVALKHSGERLPHSADQVLASIARQPGRREQVIADLETIPGKHLVFVHYSPKHAWYDEWVFNDADITDSRIVFARMCSPESDSALIRAMNDRQVWIAEPDSVNPLVHVMSAPNGPAPPAILSAAPLLRESAPL